jgi:hypothetical protein
MEVTREVTSSLVSSEISPEDVRGEEAMEIRVNPSSENSFEDAWHMSSTEMSRRDDAFRVARKEGISLKKRWWLLLPAQVLE